MEDKSPEAKRTGGDNNCRCAGNLNMKKRQVKYPKRGNEKAAGELPVKGKMKKQQADACNLCDQ